MQFSHKNGNGEPSDSELQATGEKEVPPSYAAMPAASSSAGTQPVFRTQFACITLNMTDLIRFINFPAQDGAHLQGVIQAAWPEGIQQIGPYGRSMQIKLRGRPWAYRSSGADESRLLVLRVLEVLYNRGWVLLVAMDMSKKKLDKDTLMFRSQNPAPPECHWLAISFDNWDKLKIVGDIQWDLAQAVIQTFGSELSEHELVQGRLMLKFYGDPWLPNGNQTVETRILVLALLQTLETYGYTVYSSIDMTNGPDGSETDVIFVHKQKDWQPGMPIWHR